MYDYQKKVAELHRCLQDELSKNLFWARLQYETEPSMTNAMRMVHLSCGMSKEESAQTTNWKDVLRQKEKKILLYGTGFTGQKIAAALQEDHMNFYGFCGRRAASFSDGLMGKPVVSPDYLFDHADEFNVIITAEDSYEEILHVMRENHFPEDQILSCFDLPNNGCQYFEFPALFPRGTAFIDGGCFDCRDSIRFSEWCAGQYSNIFAFEPDPKNFQRCQTRAKAAGIRNFDIAQAGLSKSTGTASFVSKASLTSHILDSTEGLCEGMIEEVQTVEVDDIKMDDTIGFIKMDIEGAEYDALHGAEAVITRDKPLLAICVEHRFGDMLAIMEYLHQIVPGYHFWLRCYGPAAVEIILYASVEKL